MHSRGVEFLKIPTTYYDQLEERVGKIDEDIDSLKKLGVLVDRDDALGGSTSNWLSGYSLQTVPAGPDTDPPTPNPASASLLPENVCSPT